MKRMEIVEHIIMAKILYTIGWNREKNIGVYYNDFMNRLNNDEYGCITDGDAIFTTDFWGNQFEDIVERHPECGLFVPMANRIGCVVQREPEAEMLGDDMTEHRNLGLTLYIEKYSEIEDISDIPGIDIGGVLMLLSKKLWLKAGGFKKTGILGVDNDFHWRVKAMYEKVYLMKGVYLYHWYRGGMQVNKSHLL